MRWCLNSRWRSSRSSISRRPIFTHVYQPADCLQKTFEAAERARFPLHHLMFEVTENEPARDIGHLQIIFTEYKRHGMITAIDDFGAGHSGLNMLADFQPDVLKIDMVLTRAINSDAVRYEIARAIIGPCRSLHISVIAEGVETIQEALTLRELGVRLFQGVRAAGMFYAIYTRC